MTGDRNREHFSFLAPPLLLRLPRHLPLVLTDTYSMKGRASSSNGESAHRALRRKRLAHQDRRQRNRPIALLHRHRITHDVKIPPVSTASLISDRHMEPHSDSKSTIPNGILFRHKAI